MIKKAINKTNQVKPRSGGKLLLDLLESEGVEYVFGNPGTTELPFIDALIDSPAVKYIWGLQEASVVAMMAMRRRRDVPVSSIYIQREG